MPIGIGPLYVFHYWSMSRLEHMWNGMRNVPDMTGIFRSYDTLNVMLCDIALLFVCLCPMFVISHAWTLMQFHVVCARWGERHQHIHCDLVKIGVFVPEISGGI